MYAPNDTISMSTFPEEVQENVTIDKQERMGELLVNSGQSLIPILENMSTMRDVSGTNHQMVTLLLVGFVLNVTRRRLL